MKSAARVDTQTVVKLEDRLPHMSWRVPGSLNVNGDIAHEVVQNAGLGHMSLAPGSGVKLVKGGDVGRPSHIEALGVVVDRVCALQPHNGMLLAGQGASTLAAEHVLHKETALGPALGAEFGTAFRCRFSLCSETYQNALWKLRLSTAVGYRHVCLYAFAHMFRACLSTLWEQSPCQSVPAALCH